MSSHTELSVKRIVAKEKQKTNFGAFTVVNWFGLLRRIRISKIQNVI
jgi:hypothetical protein